MFIIDTQFHVGPGGIEETLAGMNALGIDRAVVDEWWVSKLDGSPYIPLASGSMRPVGRIA